MRPHAREFQQGCSPPRVKVDCPQRFFFHQESHQLLRAGWRREEFGEHRAAHAAVKQRNRHSQTTQIEAAKMAPRNSPELTMLYDREKQKGNVKDATC